MRKIILTIFIGILMSTNLAFAQKESNDYQNPPSGATDWISYWCQIPVNTIVNQAELIFEGRILTDTVFFQRPPGMVFTGHRILVLKQFKGNFKSDTIEIASGGGRMIINDSWVGDVQYTHKGDEAVFFVSRQFNSQYKITNPNLFFQIYSDGCGFIKVCNKKDVTKEVYEPIEAATGQKYVDVHPNTCATQQVK